MDGCNKIYCGVCGTLQCYVCRKTINSYDHFNDLRRGGRVGRCPLFDSTEKRHQEEVELAEKEALEKAAKEHPDLVSCLFYIFPTHPPKLPSTAISTIRSKRVTGQ